MTIAVTPNNPPIAVDDNAATTENTAVAIDVLANDSDPDGDPITVADTSLAQHGTVAVNGDQTLTYTPESNFDGSDSFTYTIQDASSFQKTTATVTITVTAVNDPPVAANDSASTPEDTAVTIAVLANDSDPNGDALTSVLVSGPSHGSVTLNADGSFSYTPAANFNGADSFTYKASDGTADSNVATVNVTVNPVNDPPVAKNDGVNTNVNPPVFDPAVGFTEEDTPLTIPGAALTANDTDVDQDNLSVEAVSNPVHGTVVLNDDGAITFTPDPNFNTQNFDWAAFDYIVTDGNGGSDTGTNLIDVESVNDLPIANPDTAETDEDTPIDITGFLDNDTDVESRIFVSSFGITSCCGDVVYISAEDAGTDTFRFTPDPNFFGTFTFQYFIRDMSNGLAANPGIITVTVHPVNDAPVAKDDSASTNEDIAVDINVLGNDTDVDNSAAQLSVAAGSIGVPAHGTAVLNANGTIKYKPAANYNGSDSFTYQASDGRLTSNSATVNITVAAVNDAPNCSGAIATPSDNKSNNHEFVRITISGITDVEGQSITITVTRIYQDEPVNVTADGSTGADGRGVGTSTAEVRAERAGGTKKEGNGRVYHIFFTASDGHGGSCSGEVKVKVSVPYSSSSGPAADGGAIYDSTRP